MEPAILERPEHPISRQDIDANVLKVLYRLINADHIAYLVGGSVRDLMMGRRPKDFDVATSAHPHEVRELFRNSRLIGRRFRLVHVFFGPQNIEVATFRRLTETTDSDDPLIRHDNTFGSPEEDAFRRDFTVNALFYDPRTFRVIDYVGGVPDLHARLIRTIGDPELRMREDPVRMVRAVRFAAKLGFAIEPATHAAIERHCADLARASAPRLVEETFRTLGHREAARALVLLERLGLLSMMLPALSACLRPYASDLANSAPVRCLDAFGASLQDGAEPSRALLLAALFTDACRAAGRDNITAYLGELVEDLRICGFSRADTEHMRMLLHALAHMLAPSRVTRRLARRPYFAEARRLFAWVAPLYGVDDAAFDAFLAAPPAHHGPARVRHPREGAHGANGVAHPAPRRPRRRHRGGRRRHRADRAPHSDPGAGAEAPTAASAPTLDSADQPPPPDHSRAGS